MLEENPDLAIFNLQLNALKDALQGRSTLILDQKTTPFNLLTGDKVQTGAAGGHPQTLSFMADLPQKPGQLRPTVNPVAGTEDASSQALTEALGSSFLLVRLLGIVLVAAFVFRVSSRSIPTRSPWCSGSGKPVGTGDQIPRQGLHWALPHPIEGKCAHSQR